MIATTDLFDLSPPVRTRTAVVTTVEEISKGRLVVEFQYTGLSSMLGSKVAGRALLARRDWPANAEWPIKPGSEIKVKEAPVFMPANECVTCKGTGFAPPLCSACRPCPECRPNQEPESPLLIKGLRQSCSEYRKERDELSELVLRVAGEHPEVRAWFGMSKDQGQELAEPPTVDQLINVFLVYGQELDRATVEAWTPDERSLAGLWVAREIAHANDNPVERLPRPEFIPEIPLWNSKPEDEPTRQSEPEPEDEDNRPDAAMFSFVEEGDSCSPGGENLLVIETVSEYLVIKTERWAVDVDQIDAFAARLRRCASQVKGG